MPSRTSQKYDSIAAAVMTLADEMYGLLARTFPVCCYSDEFYFFPQVVVDEIDWRLWDDFSPDRVEDVSRKLARWVLELDALGSGDACPGDLIDISLLIHLAVTLREQLEEVRFHRTQPTFHLAIVTAGLLQAIENFGKRLGGLQVRESFLLPRAMATARKYSLRPAYQMCYTVGLNRFRSLSGGRNRTETVRMAGKILRQGEIGFDELGRTLR